MPREQAYQIYSSDPPIIKKHKKMNFILTFTFTKFTQRINQIIYHPLIQQLNQYLPQTMAPLQATLQQFKGFKKTSRQAETAAFMCLLVYFTVKRIFLNDWQVFLAVCQVCTVWMFCVWENYLWGREGMVAVFVTFLGLNAYFMLTTGKNPGFYKKKIKESERSMLMAHYEQLPLSNNSHSITNYSNFPQIPPLDQQITLSQIRSSDLIKQKVSQQMHASSTLSKSSRSKVKVSQRGFTLAQQQSQSLCPPQGIPFTHPFTPQLLQNFCRLCQCIKRNRTKHCYGCGRCVMKFDHHCPWIGSCVGQLNHGKFVLGLVAHTIQASFTLYVCINSLQLYTYYDEKTQTFSTQYGVLVLWSLFMAMYVLFAGGLLIFHSYLIGANITTRELLSRRKCSYLKDLKSNPFDQGVIKNVTYALCPDQDGRYSFYVMIFREWIIEKRAQNEQINKGWVNKIFKNEYYECC